MRPLPIWFTCSFLFCSAAGAKKRTYNEFALNLLRHRHMQQANTHGGGPYSNEVTSPYGAAVGMLSLAAGARGNTADEIYEAVAVSPDQVGEFLKIGGTGKFKTAFVANVISKNKGPTSSPKFIETLQGTFFGHYSDSEAAASKLDSGGISALIELGTNGVVKGLPPSGSPSAKSLALWNGTTFKGLWEYPFWKESTKKASFYLTDDHVERKSVLVDTMANSGGNLVRDYHKEELQVVELPFTNKHSMLIWKPLGNQTLARLEEELDLKLFDAVRKNIASKKARMARLRVPRFAMTSSYDLEPALRASGIEQIFDPNRADLSPISSSPLALDSVVHGAGIRIQERGTEPKGGPRYAQFMLHAKLLDVIIDKPSAFHIIDESGRIILGGRIGNPPPLD